MVDWIIEIETSLLIVYKVRIVTIEYDDDPIKSIEIPNKIILLTIDHL